MHALKTYKFHVFILVLFAGIGGSSGFAAADPAYEATAAASPSESLYDLFASASIPSPSADPVSKTDGAGPAPAAVPSTAPARGFFTRLGHAYLDDWTVDSNGSPAAPEPARRGTPRPLELTPVSRCGLADGRYCRDRCSGLQQLHPDAGDQREQEPYQDVRLV